MAQVFKTTKDSVDSIEILGVGRLEPGGQGAIPIERAALAMPELQERDPYGGIALDENGNPTPLTGSKLTAAAKEFAEARGFEITSVAEDKMVSLREESGQHPELVAEDLRQTSIAYSAEFLTPVNTDPVLNAQGGIEALTAYIPEPGSKEAEKVEKAREAAEKVREAAEPASAKEDK